MFTLGIMLAGVVLSCAALFSSRKRGPALRTRMARVDIQTLAAGILVLSTLMPVVGSGGAGPEGAPSGVTVLTFVVEAGACLCMDLVRNRGRSRAMQNWLAATLARTISEGI